jgi:hypothetical protein
VLPFFAHTGEHKAASTAVLLKIICGHDTDRVPYADGKEVVRDAQPEITISDGSLMIGASRDPGTPWSGLIDDVRIYNRIVRP